MKWSNGEGNGRPEQFWSCRPSRVTTINIEKCRSGWEVSIWIMAKYVNTGKKTEGAKWLLLHDEVLNYEPSCKFREAENIYREFVSELTTTAPPGEL